jgi:hypothetical protein
MIYKSKNKYNPDIFKVTTFTVVCVCGGGGVKIRE